MKILYNVEMFLKLAACTRSLYIRHYWYNVIMNNAGHHGHLISSRFVISAPQTSHVW